MTEELGFNPSQRQGSFLRIVKIGFESLPAFSPMVFNARYAKTSYRVCKILKKKNVIS
jgi:hypothetical protein